MTTTTTTAPHITQLRQQLMNTLADLRNRDNPMEPDRARAVAQVAGVLVDTAKVEIDYLKATGQDHSEFLSQPEAPAAPALPSGYANGTVARLSNGITQHRMKG